MKKPKLNRCECGLDITTPEDPACAEPHASRTCAHRHMAASYALQGTNLGAEDHFLHLRSSWTCISPTTFSQPPGGSGATPPWCIRDTTSRHSQVALADSQATCMAFQTDLNEFNGESAPDR